MGAIRTIFAFEGQKTELKRYSSELDEAEKCGIKMSTSVNGSELSWYLVAVLYNIPIKFSFKIWAVFRTFFIYYSG